MLEIREIQDEVIFSHRSGAMAYFIVLALLVPIGLLLQFIVFSGDGLVGMGVAGLLTNFL